MQRSRRDFLKLGVAVGALTGGLTNRRDVRAQGTVAPRARTIQTPVLNIGFEESGDPQGFPIILLHGFPDDVRAWDAVAPPLAGKGHRVIVPYLRGYGPTRFREAAAPRMAEQAAIGNGSVCGDDEGTLHTGLRVDVVIVGGAGEHEAFLLEYLDEGLIRDWNDLRH